jgi:predicted nucleotidyltransferase
MKRRIAREAAELLYSEQEKEYKQAKLKAARILGFNILPSNAEIARELDLMANEREGETRQDRLMQMRFRALELMRSLEDYNPCLVGSVWRGTARRNSDIDIIVYAETPKEILELLRKDGFSITRTEVRAITKEGQRKGSTHMNVDLSSNLRAELVVRSPSEINLQDRCEIYGDRITGLSTLQLAKVLKINPQQRFLP